MYFIQLAAGISKVAVFSKLYKVRLGICLPRQANDKNPRTCCYLY